MISAELKGRIGNQLFQYAVCRCMASKLSTDYMFWGEDWLGDNFVNLKVNRGRANVLFEEGANRYNDGIFNIKDGTHIDGYWQSEKYLNGFEDSVRGWYNVEEYDMGSNQCVIHFRAQDGYLIDNYVLPVDYFNRAKKVIKREVPEVKFFVVTDNVSMAKHYFKEDVVMSNDMGEDFKLIKSAKYKIISNSSFSWWAAWLSLPSSKMIVAPRRWMNYNYNKFKEDVFYPYDIKTKGFVYV
tara:strand:+ start:1917 stop:2636 length:720 start_codon:yes stop_codon:yes gene_type:complete